jgi:hypothetical protein
MTDKTPFRCFWFQLPEDEEAKLGCAFAKDLSSKTEVFSYLLHVINREEDSHQRFLPLVVLDLTKRIKVDKIHIIAYVVVLREVFFLANQIIYYEGMVDVFAIKQKKVRHEDSFTFEEVKEGFEIFLTNGEVFDEVSLLFVRSKVAESVHDALQAGARKTGRCTTDPVPISRSDFKLLLNMLIVPNPEFKDTTSRIRRYNIELGGTAVIQDVVNSVASIAIQSVDIFEGLFGYISTLKYLCGKNADTSISMEVYGGKSIVMNVANRTFLHMELSYDRCNQQGSFCFNVQSESFEGMVKYLDGRRAWFLNDYIKSQANSQSLIPPNTSTSKPGRVYGVTKVGEKRSYTTSSQHREDSKRIDVKLLENAIVAKSKKECVLWHEHLVWLVRQLGLPSAAAYSDIYDGIVYICSTSILSLDGMLDSIGLKQTTSSNSKRDKVYCLASALQSWYEDEGES